jgi:hypothetical protein
MLFLSSCIWPHETQNTHSNIILVSSYSLTSKFIICSSLIPIHNTRSSIISLITAGHTLLNHKRNEEILEELHVTPLEDKLCTYRHKWFQHVHRMEDNRLPKQLLDYHPKGRRRPGRPLKRLLDDITAETETGHPGWNSWWNVMMINLEIDDRIKMSLI